MTVRCTICSSFILYDEKKDKMMGVVRCSCGGHTELMRPSGKLQGEHPIYPEKTCKSILYDFSFENKRSSYKLIGNAVPVHMGRWVGEQAMKYFN